MAAIKCIAMLVFFQFVVLVTLILQCNAMIVAYKHLQKKRTLLLCAYFCSKKNKWATKTKHFKSHRLRRKPRTIWVAGGRTDQWWRNLVSGNLPSDTWNKNFRIKNLFIRW